MINQVTRSNFHDVFRAYGREENFSWGGLNALYEWLEDLKEGTGEPIELDVIALCCDFAEYTDLEEFYGDYNKEDYPDLETLQDHTIVIPVKDDGFIIQQF